MALATVSEAQAAFSGAAASSCCILSTSPSNEPAAVNKFLIEQDLRQMREYIAKLKFSFIEIRAKELFLEHLLSSNSLASLAGNETVATKEELKAAKAHCQSLQLKGKEVCSQIGKSLDDSAQLESSLASLNEKTHHSRQLISSLAAKEYPSLPFASLQQAISAKNEAVASLLASECQASDLERRIQQTAAEIAQLQDKNAQLKEREREASTSAQLAIAERLSGTNREPDRVFHWLGQFTAFIQLLASGSAGRLEIAKTVEISAFRREIHFSYGEFRAHVLLSTMDGSVERFSSATASGSQPSSWRGGSLEAADATTTSSLQVSEPLSLWVTEWMAACDSGEIKAA